MPGKSIPRAFSDLNLLKFAFSHPGREGDLRPATLWPATHQWLRYVVRVGSGTMVLGTRETLRDGDRSYRYPNLFPALRAALDAPWPAP